MAGACPPALASAGVGAGGMGAMGALLTPPEGIAKWVREFRSTADGPFHLPLWIPEPRPARDREAERRVRDFLSQWGPQPPDDAGDVELPDFGAQHEAMVEAGPTVVSPIMGLYPAEMVKRMKDRSIAWFVNSHPIGCELTDALSGSVCSLERQETQCERC